MKRPFLFENETITERECELWFDRLLRERGLSSAAVRLADCAYYAALRSPTGSFRLAGAAEELALSEHAVDAARRELVGRLWLRVIVPNELYRISAPPGTPRPRFRDSIEARA
jgi:hypothetical protein